MKRSISKYGKITLSRSLLTRIIVVLALLVMQCNSGGGGGGGSGGGQTTNNSACPGAPDLYAYSQQAYQEGMTKTYPGSTWKFTISYDYYMPATMYQTCDVRAVLINAKTHI